jgi:[ribosomal protein S5]-alanine N-acetyltransferase
MAAPATREGSGMLVGSRVILRPVRATDLDRLYTLHLEIGQRGAFFPRGVQGETTFRRQFDENGMWARNEGMLLITLPDDRIVGHIEFYPTVGYLDEHELSYLVYDPQDRGRGFASEAVDLLVRYLFETKRMNRIRLVIHSDNVPSRRLAERCGFTHEGTARGAWYNGGRHHDVEIYAILHGEVIVE